MCQVLPACELCAEVLGSMKCDCAEQLQQALHFIRDNSPGVVIYLQQEGRGIGLANKIAAYSLQVAFLQSLSLLFRPSHSRSVCSHEQNRGLCALMWALCGTWWFINTANVPCTPYLAIIAGLMQCASV